MIYFPGQQTRLAFTLGPGIGKDWLQSKIDQCEIKAINTTKFTDDEIEFLKDLYTCLYKGAKLTIVLPEVSKMMGHYLSGSLPVSGDDLSVSSTIFSTNAKVKKQMGLLREKIKLDTSLKDKYTSPNFYMPDKSNTDSVYGIGYHRVSHSDYQDAHQIIRLFLNP